MRKFSFFNAPIAPQKDAGGRTLRQTTVTPCGEVDVQMYVSERLKWAMCYVKKTSTMNYTTELNRLVEAVQQVGADIAPTYAEYIQLSQNQPLEQ